MESYLKVKCMSLANEAVIIRNQERKWKERARLAREKQKNPQYAESNFFGLRHHRVNDVRREARSAHLAYGFLKGNSYLEMENFSYTEPDWERIERLVEKYGEGDARAIKQQFAEWKDAATKGRRAYITQHAQPRSVREINELNHAWINRAS